MTVADLKVLIKAENLSAEPGESRQILSGYSCDLLSWVMAHGQKGMGWITVQTHLNVVAVAALAEMACVILPENIKMEGAALDKAREEELPVLSSPLDAYAICAAMAQAGVPSAS